MLHADPLPRLRTLEWVDYDALIGYLHEADVCLGIFGTSDKAASVIPNKVFQILAAGKPLITRDSPAIRELVEHSPPSVTLIPAGNPARLAEAIARCSAQDVLYGAGVSAEHAFNVSAIGRQLIRLLASGSQSSRPPHDDR
jgi:glycosyltransferase involved in cell wall biosynthesis